MNIKIIAIIIGIVVIVGGGYYFYQQQDKTVREYGSGQASGRFSGSLQDLAARGGAYRCTFAHESAAAVSEGTVYVSGSDIRGDFSSEAQGLAVESHMIQSGGYVYVWSPMMPQGFKSKSDADSAGTPAGMSGQYADLTQSYDYDCEAWSGDQSTFALPAGVTFIGAN